MRVGDIKQAIPQAEGQPPAEPAASNESRALIALAVAAVAHEGPAIFRQANFLAQLIAAKEQLPQTRTRRRAAPHEALAAYQTAAELTKAGG